MPSRALHLSQYSPSPSTTLYTVSNAPIRNTRLARLSHQLALLSRLAFAFSCILVLYLWAEEFGDCLMGKVFGCKGYGQASKRPLSLLRNRIFPQFNNPFATRLSYARDVYPGYPNTEWLPGLVGNCIASIISGKIFVGRRDWGPAVICIILLYFLGRRDHQEEQLLVIRGLGIQTSSSSASYLFSPSMRFIPTSQIQDILIHEAFIGFEVRFYLAVIIEGEEEAVVVFPKLLPKREMLEEIWRGSKNVLYRGKTG